VLGTKFFFVFNFINQSYQFDLHILILIHCICIILSYKVYIIFDLRYNIYNTISNITTHTHVCICMYVISNLVNSRTCVCL
jgi:hypothetical protein